MDDRYSAANAPSPTQEQRAAVCAIIVDMMTVITTMAPTLNENVERLRDFDKTMVSGIYLGIRSMFGDEEYAMLREVIEKVYRDQHGPLPDMNPRVVTDGAVSGVFKSQIYGDLGWNTPPGAGGPSSSGSS
jgi:hypothetical protein